MEIIHLWLFDALLYLLKTMAILESIWTTHKKDLIAAIELKIASV